MLDNDKSIMIGLATATVVYGIYQNALPNVADVRSLDARNRDVAGAERLATWTAAGVVAGISLIAKDPTVFIIGAATVTALSLWHKHANEVTPMTGRILGVGSAKATVPPQTQAQAPANYAPAPSYDGIVMA